MNTRMNSLVAALITGTLPITVVGSINSYPTNPGFGAPVYSQGELDQYIAVARANGRHEAASECLANPKTCGCFDDLKPCGVTLNSLLTGSRYGETEPNDNMVAANPLVPEKIYWGQSMSVLDQDWYYVTTQEPNQIITLNFRVPSSTTTAAGWKVSVRDAGGNVLAQFPTSLDTEIMYPVFVSFPGTYYVVVEPDSVAGLNSRPYNLIASLGFSESDAKPIDVNFYDVETEPNDGYATADPLRSTVTMYGMLHSRIDGGATVAGWVLETEEDWFYYTSPGHEIIRLDWCQRESCNPSGGRAWRVTVMDRAGTIMTSFNANSSKSILTGLEKAGDYFVQVMSELQIDAEGKITTRCQEWSDPEPGKDAACTKYAPVATLATDPYNFTWNGTRLPTNSITQ